MTDRRAEIEAAKALEQEHQELDRKLASYWDLDASIRGKILIQSIFIETMIPYTLSHQYSTNKKENDRFLKKMAKGDSDFITKINALDNLLSFCHPDLKKKYPNLICELHSLRRFRNDLAHSSTVDIDIVLSCKNLDRIILRNHRKEDAVIVTKKDVELWLKRCREIVRMLLTIINEVSEKAIPK